MMLFVLLDRMYAKSKGTRNFPVFTELAV
jgi:hypothetical protein